MWLSEDDAALLSNLIDKWPRTPIRGLRKIDATTAIRTTYHVNWCGKRPYEVEVWYVDTKQGARWVEATTRSALHRRTITKVKALLRMARLQQIVEG